MPTTMDVNELNRINMLQMPASRLEPGGRYVLIYKAPLGLKISEASLIDKLNGSSDFYGTTPVVQIGKVVVVGIRMRLNPPPKSTIVEAVVDDYRTTNLRLGLDSLRLAYLLPRANVVASGSTTKDSYGRIAAIASQSPTLRNDPLGIKKVTDVVNRIASGAGGGLGSVLKTAKWVSFGVIAIVLLVVLWPVIKETRAGK